MPWPHLAALARLAPGLALAASPALPAPRELHVQGVSLCPTPAALAAALRRALPQARISTGPGRRPGSIVIELTAPPGPGSRGRYRVTVLGRERRFVDPGGHCEERARAAAVFVALEVDPPRLLAEPATPPPASAAPPAPAPASAAPAPRVDLDLDIEGGPILLFAPRGGRGEAGLLALGMDLRAVLCRRAFCGALGVTGLPIWPAPLTLPLEGASARLMRVPLHLSARARLRRGRFEAAVEVGGVLAVLLAEGLDLPGAVAPRSWDTRLEGGARLHGLLRAWVRPGLALSFGLEAQVAPAPYALVIEAEEGPRLLGRTPSAWLGLQAGLSARALGGRF